MTSSATPGRILVVDDEPDLRVLYELTLIREGYGVETAGCVEEAWELLQDDVFAAVISDMRLPDGTGLALLDRLEKAGRAEKVIVITAYGSPENAVKALKAGAFDYLTKPVDLKQFRLVVASAVGRPTGGRRWGDKNFLPAIAGRQGRDNTLTRMVGSSAPMCQIRALIDKVGRSMAPVLIQGESGTGKELVARAIHESGVRASQAFVAVNCGAIPEHLLEAEFFGYRKGAFTGATEDRGGFFQAAQGGTLFLDEIGDLPLLMQTKLLRVIQERAVRPIGMSTEMPIDVRILSATHRDLSQEVQAGRFRQDLFYRLNVIEIRVPPLRERREDVAELSSAILNRLSQDMGDGLNRELSATAHAALQHHPFVGNVRELENMLHRAMALSSGTTIDAADLGLAEIEPVELTLPTHDTHNVSAPASSLNTSPSTALPTDLARYLDDMEREILVRALDNHNHNRTAAGQRLGLTLRQMRYRMARLGIHLDGEAPLPEDMA
ncbi:MAG: sigma-54-dependent transcriptional regulator [Leptothrix ochracea]|uniref:sigma-54-dependent transcriptional regulator n=1 Tax=Leptothrix ochracea TaxID=735331 RepID=UPI0034E1D1A1